MLPSSGHAISKLGRQVSACVVRGWHSHIFFSLLLGRVAAQRMRKGRRFRQCCDWFWGCLLDCFRGAELKAVMDATVFGGCRYVSTRFMSIAVHSLDTRNPLHLRSLRISIDSPDAKPISHPHKTPRFNLRISSPTSALYNQIQRTFLPLTRQPCPLTIPSLLGVRPPGADGRVRPIGRYAWRTPRPLAEPHYYTSSPVMPCQSSHSPIL